MQIKGNGDERKMGMIGNWGTKEMGENRKIK